MNYTTSETRIMRSDAIFLSKSTHRALRLIAKASELTCTDALAEQVLASWIKANHSDVSAHLNAQQEAGDAFAKALHEKLKPKQA